MSQCHTTEPCLLCLHSTHRSGSAVYAAVRDDLGESDDPVVDLVSSSSLHCKNKWCFKYEFCNKYNFYEKILGTFPTLYVQGFYFCLELDIKTQNISNTHTHDYFKLGCKPTFVVLCSSPLISGRPWTLHLPVKTK